MYSGFIFPVDEKTAITGTQRMCFDSKISDIISPLKYNNKHMFAVSRLCSLSAMENVVKNEIKIHQVM